MARIDRVIDGFKELGIATVQQIAKAVGLTKSDVRFIIPTLQRRNLINLVGRVRNSGSSYENVWSLRKARRAS